LKKGLRGGGREGGREGGRGEGGKRVEGGRNGKIESLQKVGKDFKRNSIDKK
jgi:hypothetical protein